jgi:hypothetical protein
MIKQYFGRIKLHKGIVVEKDIKVYLRTSEKGSEKGLNNLLTDILK